jgi:deazaflavin-dependent oxidoreductase (nitroreductase family)
MNGRGVIGLIANQVTMWALLTGIPRPPYTRGNAIIIETVGRRSGQRRRVPVGYLEDEGKLIVVIEDGRRADWVRNALAHDSRLRVFLRGRWLDGRLSLIEGDPQEYLRLMNKLHAALVRRHSSTPGVAQIIFA